MRVRSLGYRSSLMFTAFEGEVLDRGSHLVVRTPRNPTYRWGNYLLFDAPPGPGDVERWPALFEHEMADVVGTGGHRAFGWDDPSGEEGELAPFLDAGYRVDRSGVLTASRVVPPPRPSRTARTRPLRSEEDWARATQNQILCREEQEDEEGFRLFKERQMRSYREMAASGLGAWFGAFEGDRLVADLGLFVEGDVGRFQQVCTAPDRRRRGLCGTLVHAAAAFGFEHMGARTLVLVAEDGGPPARIYASVGFEPTERMVGIDRVEAQAAIVPRGISG